MRGVNEALYVLWRAGCLHPFRLSRILMLAEWKYEELYRRRLTEFKYAGTEFGFYIEGLPEILEGTGCVKKEKITTPEGERGCLKYVCEEEPACKAKEILDEIIEKVSGLDDVGLNKLVIKDPRYKAYISGT